MNHIFGFQPSAPISCQHSSPGTPPLLTYRCDTYIISAALCSLRCSLLMRNCTHTCTLHHTMHFVVQINIFIIWCNNKNNATVTDCIATPFTAAQLSKGMALSTFPQSCCWRVGATLCRRLPPQSKLASMLLEVSRPTLAAFTVIDVGSLYWYQDTPPYRLDFNNDRLNNISKSLAGECVGREQRIVLRVGGRSAGAS